MPTTPLSRIVRFGTFEVNLDTGELRHRGQKVKLQQQPFQVLVALLEQPGELVTREELRGKLWPADTFVDFDHSLNAAVKRLREALGDSAEVPTFIETLARRGYRFIGNVDRPAGSQSDSPAGPDGESVNKAARGSSPGRVSGFWKRKGLLAVTVLTILVATGITAAWFRWRNALRSKLPQASPTLQRLTTNSAQNGIIASAISPDGKYLAYSDKSGVHLRRLSTGESHTLLSKVSSVTSLAWFPDGAQVLASWATSQEKKQLWSLSIVGGEPRQMSDEGWAASISPDGSQIVFLKGAEFAEMGHEIWVMRSNGADQRKLLSFPEGQLASPAWSPDGRWIAYVKYQVGPYASESSIEIFNLKQNASRTLLSKERVTGWGMTWLSDGRLVYALDEPSPESSSNFWAATVDLGNGRFAETAARITSGDGYVVKPSATSDGKHLVFNRARPQADVYIAEFSSDGPNLTTPRQITFDVADDIPFDWTPDNKAVLFISSRTGTESIFRQPIDGPSAEMLVPDGERKTICRSNPDGTQILYLVFKSAGGNSQTVRLMRASMNGGPPQMVLEAPGLDNYQCSRAPATVCVFSQLRNSDHVFSTFDETLGKARELAKVRLPGANWNWGLSPDGRSIAAVTFGAENNRVHLIPVSGGPIRELVVKNGSGFNAVDWAADSKGLFLSSNPTGMRQSLLYVDLAGNSHPIWQSDNLWPSWAVPSRDGKFIAMPRANLDSNVWMTEHF
jgi:Tol biopolymer transport system component/DNA-binding winged helix-turn-helix (wHTH) protein